ncbi:MAG TPA: GRP family sugar transporter [Cyclobacteriaceae bacterium]|nr:GRP family sugar transporter [Cyclobacteriaceae bacterium]
MFILPSYTAAVICCIITMICWGSWANTQKLAAAGWRFELFYWDYVIGIVLLSLAFALTLGSFGEEGRSFIVDLKQANTSSLTSAMMGGVIFNAANILLGAAIAIAGMSVAFPVGIGLALVIGVVVNYLRAPEGNPIYLFGGVALITAAIMLNARSYQLLQKNSKAPTRGIWLAVISGSLMGLFYQFVAASMFIDFTVPESGKLSPYTAVVVFSLGILVSNFLFNTLLMRRPFTGNKVSYADYFGGNFKSHAMGILGGAIWCVGMSLSIIAADQAGPAISYGLGQGATVVAACWGIFVWKEFSQAPNTKSILLGMLLCYTLGLILIIAAR